jgi:hypothetical protein
MSRARQEQLRQRIQEVLINEWDPLLVKDSALAHNEYDSYISGIQRLLDQGCDVYRPSRHLDQLETVSMGLRAPSGRGGAAAARLLAILTPPSR